MGHPWMLRGEDRAAMFAGGMAVCHRRIPPT